MRGCTAVTPAELAHATSWLRNLPNEASRFMMRNGLTMRFGLRNEAADKLIDLARAPYREGEVVLAKQNGTGLKLTSIIVRKVSDHRWLCALETTGEEFEVDEEHMHRKISIEDILP